MKKKLAIFGLVFSLFSGIFLAYTYNAHATDTYYDYTYGSTSTGNHTANNTTGCATGGGIWEINESVGYYYNSSYLQTKSATISGKSVVKGMPYLSDIYADSNSTTAKHYGSEYFGVPINNNTKYTVSLGNNQFKGSNRKVAITFLSDKTAAVNHLATRLQSLFYFGN
ncbi:hypothetical protein ABWW58_07270 [Sporolactobacillus sp. STCC-11]|uniref:hypothetical protein n=1 Tax=Sporolactobacillus caesalpiniae TaxID=3230362 RepID=UPI00339692CF